MTKSWEEVRDLICTLYLSEGKSLTETRKIVQRQRGFTASDRAYRMKLKEWRFKRGDAASNMSTYASPDLSSSGEDESHERSSPVTPTLSFSQTTEIDFNAPGEEESSFEAMFRYVAELRTLHKVYPVIQRLPFEDGKDTFLHYIAQQTESLSSTIQNVVKSAQAAGHSLDVRNVDGETPLEVAIRTENVDNVSILLAGGASVKTRNANGENPLHMALRSHISQKLEICVLLLVNGANPLSPIRSKHHPNRSSSTTTLFDVESEAEDQLELGDWQIDPEVFAYCLAGIQRAFGHNARFQSEGSVAFRDFLRSWKPPFPRHRVLEQLMLSCVKVFLLIGSDPFVHGVAGFTCPSGRCRTLAAFSLFHAPNCAYADLIVEASVGGYAAKLVEEILTPCAHRARSSHDTPLAALLETLLRKNARFPTSERFFSLLFTRCPDDEIEKPALLRVLVDSQVVSLHANDALVRKPMQHLLRVPDTHRLALAEILLKSELRKVPLGAEERGEDPVRGLFDSSWLWLSATGREDRLYAYLQGCVQWRYGSGSTAHWGDTVRCGCHLISDALRCKERVEREDMLRLHQCFVHVHTKAMMEDDEAPMSLKEVVYIFRLRTELRLPPLGVKSGLLLDLLGSARDGGNW